MEQLQTISHQIVVRLAERSDLERIRVIYNQGIEDRTATLVSDTKDMAYMEEWYAQHDDRYAVLVAERDGQVVGWASLSRYSNRCAYDGVAELSVYLERSCQGQGIGSTLLQALERLALEKNFHKIILFTFPFNRLGQGLYRKCGYREVGIFRNQGRLDGRFVDMMAMEKFLYEER